MPVRVYRSTDAGAPVLSGTADSLVNLLTKILVDGYGALAGSGWTKPFTAANRAVFRAGAGNQFYLDVDDSGPGAGGAREARLRGYETMTAVATGTGPFPTVAQLAAGIVARKSATLDATARAWIAVADERTLYLFLSTGDSAGQYRAIAFGEFFSYLAGDAYRTMIVGWTSENSGSNSLDPLSVLLLPGQTMIGVTTGQYWARSSVGTGIAQQFGKHTDVFKTNQAQTVGVGNIPFPNPIDGGIYVAPIEMGDPNSSPVGGVRGRMRGFWCGCHAGASFNDGDTFQGAGALAGKAFLVVKAHGNGGYYLIETSNTWDTN